MRVFVAGATGATGRVFVPLATEAGHDLALHVRPRSREKTPLAKDPRACIFDLEDVERLRQAVRGSEVIVSFVGTMRARFGAGDTYESSDLRSTRCLVDAATVSQVPRFLLLSSFGAGGLGAYLKMKGECERLVRESGLKWTIFRPSALVSPQGVEGTHGARHSPSGIAALFAGLRLVPGLKGFSDDVRPIPIEVVCRAFLRVIREPQNGVTLAGRDLWSLGSV